MATDSAQILKRVSQGVITPEQAQVMLDPSHTNDHQDDHPQHASHHSKEKKSDHQSPGHHNISGASVSSWSSTSSISASSTSSPVRTEPDHAKKASVFATLTVSQLVSRIWALMLGAWVIWLIADNRSYRSNTLKMILLIWSLLACYGWWWALMKNQYTVVWQALFVVWAFIYGANIFLIGQMYNLGGTYHEWLLMRRIGLIPLAYGVSMVLILILAWLICMIWIISWLMVLWQSSAIVFYLWALGIFFLALSWFHEQSYPGFFGLYRKVWLITTYVVFFSLTVAEWTYLWWDLAIHYSFIFIVLLSIALKLISRNKSNNDVQNIALIVHAVVLVLTHIVAVGYDAGDTYLYGNIMNALLSAYFIAMILYSIYLQLPHAHTSSGTAVINLNMIFLVWFIVVQYSRIVWEYLEWSIFFVSAGAVLLLSGFLVEMRRKKILHSSSSSSSTDA